MDGPRRRGRYCTILDEAPRLLSPRIPRYRRDVTCHAAVLQYSHLGRVTLDFDPYSASQ